MYQSGPGNSGNSPTGGGKSALAVLVVDDEPLTRWSMAEVLGERGYRVTQAGDAASALEALATAPTLPDVLLLDLHLPDSRDLTALSVIHRYFPKMAIVLITAYGSPELFDAARRRGASAVMDKPFDNGDLAAVIERAIAVSPPMEAAGRDRWLY
jgi:DNA-binding NtrC family response regulator